jgi:beta-galactosidase/beta-glucuronidase
VGGVVDNNVYFSFNMIKPKLWWTWNIGKPELYTFKVTVVQEYSDGAIDIRYMDERIHRFGIRTINWI